MTHPSSFLPLSTSPARALGLAACLLLGACVNEHSDDEPLRSEASDANLSELDPEPDLRELARRELVVIDRGHVDAIDAAFEDGALAISLHDETVEPDVERDPANVVLIVRPTAQVEIPDARFGFLGPVGATAWILPQDELTAEALGVLFVGLSTEEIEPGAFVDDTVQLRFLRVTGPGGFSVFDSPEDEVTPPVVLVDSEDRRRDVIAMPASTHRHANWAFEAPGIYRVRVDVRGRLAGTPGSPLITSSSVQLTFVVLP